jgi:hypothetical protein
MDKERKPAKKVRGAPAEGGVTKVLLCEDGNPSSTPW